MYADDVKTLIISEELWKGHRRFNRTSFYPSRMLGDPNDIAPPSLNYDIQRKIDTSDMVMILMRDGTMEILKNRFGATGGTISHRDKSMLNILNKVIEA